MAFSYRELFFGGTTFCCCMKVRVGVIIIHSSFAGLVETLLFVVSILGFVGAIVRKQLFVQIYAYFIYFHFVLNLGVAAYLLYSLVHVSTTDQVKACQLAIHDPSAQDQCTGLLKFGIKVYAAIAGVHGAIIVARYVNQIQREKRNVRASRMSQGAFKMAPSKGRYSTIKGDEPDSIPLRAASFAEPPSSHKLDEFDPYEEVAGPDYRGSSYNAYDGMPPSADVEHGLHNDVNHPSAHMNKPSSG
ncbi:DUF1746 domain-containing protein [Favolaschia claudopus]|uniref:DUF1746 domain-containing protein n=1 Tax=Favolaschia claudopus TaxID=2862362 RepID=A0AAW0DVX6_9AGAR